MAERGHGQPGSRAGTHQGTGEEARPAQGRLLMGGSPGGKLLMLEMFKLKGP